MMKVALTNAMADVATKSVNATVEKMAQTAELISHFPSVQSMSGPEALRNYARVIRDALDDVRDGKGPTQ